MADPDAPTHAASHRAADAARAEEEDLRARWEHTQEALLKRFDEPIARATEITQRTLAWFPVRVWRHFLQHNGFLLAAGVSYQALFSVFAAVYVAFTAVGIWLGGSPEVVDRLIALIDGYVPGLIGEAGESVFTTAQVMEIATGSTGVLAITGVIALVTAIWTAIGFITYVRRAVRDIFGLPPDTRGYVLLKARDFVAALAFGLAIVVGSILINVGTWALRGVLGGLGVPDTSFLYNGVVQGVSVIISLALNAVALGALFWFMIGTSRRWRTTWPGSLAGGIALTVLQLAGGLLLLYTPSNPLLATFTIFIGLMLWFRLIGIVMLVAAAWIAVTSQDAKLPLLETTEAQRLWDEHRALLVAAQVRLRTATDARASAPWYRRWSADRAVAQAHDELAQVQAAAPPDPHRKSSLFD